MSSLLIPAIQTVPCGFARRRAADRLLGSLGSAITTEVLGLAGFDWILLDGEHVPMTCSLSSRS